MVNLGPLFPMLNDSGTALVLRLAGATVGGSGIGGSAGIPASPVFGHTAGKPYFIKSAFQSFGGNNTFSQQTPVSHGLPSGKFSAVSFHAMPTNSWFGIPGLYANTDQSTVYLQWILPTTALGNSVFNAGQTYSFVWTLVAQLL